MRASIHHFIPTLPLFAAVAGICLAAPTLRADTITWAKAGIDFNNSANWNAGAGPVPGDADVALFPGGATVNPNLTASRALNGISFDIFNSGYVISSDPGASILINNGGTLTANIPVNSAVISASIADAVLPTATPGTFFKTGQGTLALTGITTYTGTTNVNFGLLLFNGTHNGGGLVTGLGNSSIVGGNGVINGRVTTVSNLISPGAAGDTAGKLTINSTASMVLDFNLGGTYDWQLGALKDDATGTAGVDFDQIALIGAGGNARFNNGQLRISFLNNSLAPDAFNADPFWNSPHQWTVVTSSGISSGLSNFGVNGSSLRGVFSSLADGAGNVVLRWTPNGIPEPSSLGLLGLGLAMLARRRDRR